MTKLQTKELTTFQLKAARRALDIPLRDISKETGIDVNALCRLESGNLGSFPKKSQLKTISRLRLFLESHGIEFLANGAVRFEPKNDDNIVFRMKE